MQIKKNNNLGWVIIVVLLIIAVLNNGGFGRGSIGRPDAEADKHIMINDIDAIYTWYDLRSPCAKAGTCVGDQRVMYTDRYHSQLFNENDYSFSTYEYHAYTFNIIKVPITDLSKFKSLELNMDVKIESGYSGPKTYNHGGYLKASIDGCSIQYSSTQQKYELPDLDIKITKLGNILTMASDVSPAQTSTCDITGKTELMMSVTGSGSNGNGNPSWGRITGQINSLTIGGSISVTTTTTKGGTTTTTLGGTPPPKTFLEQNWAYVAAGLIILIAVLYYRRRK